MTREEARNELESRLHQPLDRILPGELYALLCDQYILRREAEARVKELECTCGGFLVEIGNLKEQIMSGKHNCVNWKWEGMGCRHCHRFFYQSEKP